MPGRRVAPRALLFTALLAATACTAPRPQESGQRSEDATPAAAREAATIDLVHRFTAGERWIEDVEVVLTSQRGDEAPSPSPTMVERRRDRFEVLAVDGGAAELRVTAEHLRVEPRGGSPVDSDETPPAGVDPLILDRLVWVGLPVTYRLDERGATLAIIDEDGVRAAAAARLDALREAAALPPATDEEREGARKAVDDELRASRAWGVRPRFPAGPIAADATWAATVEQMSLFGAAVTWSITERLREVGDATLTIAREGDASFQETPAMRRFLRSADAHLVGAIEIDRRSGALLRSEATVSGSVDAAPQPEVGFAGGVMKMQRTITRRRRADDVPG